MKPMSVTFTLILLVVGAGLAHGSEDRPGVTFRHPSPAPDNSMVVFESDFGDPSGPLNLWISNFDGSNLHKLTQNSGTEVNPTWSPDGSKIVFASSVNGVSDIWIINPDGTGLLQLTKQSLNNTQPAWSPDGSKIAFVSNRGGTNDIWIMNVDGSNVQRLTSLPGQENHPGFSPDGQSIVFSETMGTAAQLMVISLTTSGPPVAITSSGFNDWNPNWSEAGIIFSSNRDNTSEHWKIWQVQFDGSGLTKVGDVVALDPVWTVDGKVLFSDELGGPPHASATITLLAPATGTKSVVAGTNGFLAAIKIDGRDGKPVIVLDDEDPIKVAILSQANFDAVSSVNLSTLTFGKSGTENSLIRCERKGRDITHNGLLDLVCLFNARKTGLKPGHMEAILGFGDNLGVPYQGSQSVSVIHHCKDARRDGGEDHVSGQRDYCDDRDM